MKNVVVTVIVGFITGLILSGIIFDVIKYIGKSFNRVSVSWNISKAEKFYSQGRFSDSVLVYNKTLSKIPSDNKLLIAKTKNNLALAVLKEIETTNNIVLDNEKKSLNVGVADMEKLEEALKLLNQSNDLYIETGNTELSVQTSKNINIINDIIKKQN